ncbi:hypothetical protein E2986_13229 [Frieseomelitta varia]|uniref:Uncharacterized protein n=1 Tax=Frieseomelitta varia TaxID=561572 RepID=A0A833RBU1_9HYME|nr:hypothetical protein E2986_13229 [Frieseomelitta varia]
MLCKTDDRGYLNTFGKLRFQNELHELRRRLGSEWHEKLNEIEEAVLNSDKPEVIPPNSKIINLYICFCNIYKDATKQCLSRNRIY